MAGRSSVLVVGIVAALGGLALLNASMNRLQNPDAEKPKTEATETREEEAPKLPLQTGESLVLAKPDVVVGSEQATQKITVGWAWTPEVQAQPDTVLVAVNALKKAFPDAQVRIASVDVVEDVAPGVVVNNQTVWELPPHGMLNVEEIKAAVQSAMQK